jgi:putative endonuclease
MFHTYIIYSASTDRYYTGHTSVGVGKRLQRHNNGWKRSTKAGIPWELRYYKSFEEKSLAIKWEGFIKEQKSRSFIQRLIDSDENEAVK